LPLHDDPAAAEGATTYDSSNIEQAEWSEEDCAQSLVAVLTRLRAQVPEQALALFAALVADRDLFERLARDQLALPQARILALQNKLGGIVGNLRGWSNSTTSSNATGPGLRKALGLPIRTPPRGAHCSLNASSVS
jgi:hypothetical protein